MGQLALRRYACNRVRHCTERLRVLSAIAEDFGFGISSITRAFCADVGLLTCLSGMDAVRNLLADRPDINYGALYENAVAQELAAHGRPLFYFKKRNIGELDFLLQNSEQRVVPLEVKSGKGYTRHSALNHALGTPNYGIEEAIVLCNANVKVDGPVSYLPVYMAMLL